MTATTLSTDSADNGIDVARVACAPYHGLSLALEHRPQCLHGVPHPHAQVTTSRTRSMQQWRSSSIRLPFASLHPLPSSNFATLPVARTRVTTTTLDLGTQDPIQGCPRCAAYKAWKHAALHQVYDLSSGVQNDTLEAEIVRLRYHPNEAHILWWRKRMSAGAQRQPLFTLANGNSMDFEHPTLNACPATSDVDLSSRLIRSPPRICQHRRDHHILSLPGSYIDTREAATAYSDAMPRGTRAIHFAGSHLFTIHHPTTPCLSICTPPLHHPQCLSNRARCNIVKIQRHRAPCTELALLQAENTPTPHPTGVFVVEALCVVTATKQSINDLEPLARSPRGAAARISNGSSSS
ncbi:hypothetical protein C8R45DRAFT_1097971 [Mycena sanguinolenta]|nr:hypothetical protein C8R45DRAFT_1097971 [Mycena sanguinolenta]